MITIVVGPDGSEGEFLIYADLAKRHSRVIETNIQLATGSEKSRLFSLTLILLLVSNHTILATHQPQNRYVDGHPHPTWPQEEAQVR